MGGVGGRAAVFLDRDGTLNVSPPPGEYLRSASEFRWAPGAPAALGALARAGYALFVVSNQRGVARGLVAPAALAAIEREIAAGLASEGCAIEAFRYCPHELDEGCACRKPMPGMIEELAREHDLDLARSWMIGDTVGDHLAGRAAGCRTTLLGSHAADEPAPDVRAPDIADAARAILSLVSAR